MSDPRILIAEDDAALREALIDTLNFAGYDALACENGEQALQTLHGDDRIALVLSDVQMAPVDGMQLLRQMRESRLEQPVVLMTAYGNVPKAVAAVQAGAADYLPKPFEAQALLDKVDELLTRYETPSADFVAEDASMRDLLGLAQRVSGAEASVMISGESGSGKEVLARYVHDHSPRAGGPFIAINCAAIPENMLEAVLFGYEKGAYTGAYKTTPGKFEQAQGGTLLLDEISEMDMALQAKLLRVLQEREVERLGGREVIQLDVRILATTNRVLREEVDAGRFREDLFYRLNVFPLHLPPLRERVGDILPLAQALLARHGCENHYFSSGAKAQLVQHAWPGNVRELDNVVQRALVLARGEEILAGDILFEGHAEAPPAVTERDDGTLETDLRSREQQMIIDTLEACGGRRKEAAEALGISPRTLRYKLSRMREQGLQVPGDRSATL